MQAALPCKICCTLCHSRTPLPACLPCCNNANFTCCALQIINNQIYLGTVLPDESNISEMCQHTDRCVSSITECVRTRERFTAPCTLVSCANLQNMMRFDSLQHFNSTCANTPNMMRQDGLKHDHINPGSCALPMLGAPRSAVVVVVAEAGE